MYLNGEKIVDNDDCHGERERGSGDKFLKPGAHEIVVDMCERGGGEVFKMRWKGPDSGNSKVKIPATALKHEKAPSRIFCTAGFKAFKSLPGRIKSHKEDTRLCIPRG